MRLADRDMKKSRAVRDNPKPKLTDAERHARFLDAAKKAEASDNPDDLKNAVMKVAYKMEASVGRRRTQSQ